ncbi:MAG: hypothetical protein AB7H77_06060 [Bdellovibrionales bacterium]
MLDKNTLYTNWLEYVFNRPATDPEWYFGENEDFRASQAEMVYLIGRTCERSGNDLAGYSNEQVNNGLSYMFFCHASNTVYAIIQEGCEEREQIEAVKKMKILYRDCLAKRCDPVLSHKHEATSNPLSYFCYMLWDVSPLRQWKDIVIEVMETALYLPNPTCIESALHGLGHRYYQNPDAVRDVIDRFLSSNKDLDSELKHYARQARTGKVM